jgi:hypothetical protein
MHKLLVIIIHHCFIYCTIIRTFAGYFVILLVILFQIVIFANRISAMVINSFLYRWNNIAKFQQSNSPNLQQI